MKRIHVLVCKYGLEDLWGDEKRVWDVPLEDRSSGSVKRFWIKPWYIGITKNIEIVRN